MLGPDAVQGEEPVAHIKGLVQGGDESLKALIHRHSRHSHLVLEHLVADLFHLAEIVLGRGPVVVGGAFVRGTCREVVEDPGGELLHVPADAGGREERPGRVYLAGGLPGRDVYVFVHHHFVHAEPGDYAGMVAVAVEFVSGALDCKAVILGIMGIRPAGIHTVALVEDVPVHKAVAVPAVQPFLGRGGHIFTAHQVDACLGKKPGLVEYVLPVVAEQYVGLEPASAAEYPLAVDGENQAFLAVLVHKGGFYFPDSEIE